MKQTEETLRGRTVLSRDGLAIGEIGPLTFDDADWRVATVQVKLRREIAERIGVSHGLFHAATIDLPIELVQSVGDVVILTVPVDALRSPPPPPAAPRETTPPVH